MTRRRDLMCEDIFGCCHEPEIPISQDGEIVAWVCACGARTHPVSPKPAASEDEDKEG